MMEISDCERNKTELYDDPKTIIPPRNLDELIQELHKVFASDHVNVEYVSQLMAAYRSNPKDWKKFAIFDLHRYTRNLVDAGNGKFNLMVLCWNTSQGSAIHDHANAHCFMKVLDGHAQEELFDWPAGSEEMHTMTSKGKNLYKKQEVAYISDEIGLHRVENPSHSDTAVTLHLYSPPFSECQSFDERTGNANKVQVTFWSQYGKRTPCAKLPSSCVPENN
ncbi:cysteine dioxygenase type 1-like [Ostrea edulis]|uniref:cysteine dioxygenase type 1-like n=1 Tax=Ostrea edulis TaxID=37623 RepID=UPI0024AF3CCD|nr:cysteine dioxygenase type 1-like [Ostrea edulis]